MTHLEFWTNPFFSDVFSALDDSLETFSSVDVDDTYSSVLLLLVSELRFTSSFKFPMRASLLFWWCSSLEDFFFWASNSEGKDLFFDDLELKLEDFDFRPCEFISSWKGVIKARRCLVKYSVNVKEKSEIIDLEKLTNFNIFVWNTHFSHVTVFFLRN